MEAPQIELQGVLSFIKWGLENLKSTNNDLHNIPVKDITIINATTLCCTFYAASRNSADIKMEMASIIGFFNGFYRNGYFQSTAFSHYALIAIDEKDEELLYAISSKKTAELIGSGQSIDWLKSTYFQENTSDSRLSQAKRIIFEIENCLREIIKKLLFEHFGKNWWELALDNKLGKSVKETYQNQFDLECNDGNILIDYTFTIHLKKIILTHWSFFKQYFDSPLQFENRMDRLNNIRREEAHNRNISAEHLAELDELHEKLLSKVLTKLTDFQSVYLTENWRIKIKKIMTEEHYQPTHNPQDVIDEKIPVLKLLKTTENTEALIGYVGGLILKIQSVVAPIHKRELKTELIAVLQKFKDLQIKLLNLSAELDERKIKNVLTEINEHRTEMDMFVNRLLLSEG